MARGDDIHQRLLKHGAALGRLCKTLPLNPEATHVRQQLFRCATAAAPNYAEARSAESRADFIHKLGIVLKELNESRSCLGFLRVVESIPESTLGPLVKENDELCRIIYTSIKTARGEPAGR